MMPMRDVPRSLASLIALSALFGFAVQFKVTFTASGAIAGTLWILLRYFTIISNLLAALVFAGVASRPARYGAPALRGGITLTLLLVAVVYHLLLRGTLVQTDPERLADVFLHSVTPALVVLHWVLCTPRGGLRPRDPLLWAVLPVLYLGYALVRGGADGLYPYPFLDVARLGWWQVGLNAVLIALGFLAAGFALVWFDRRLGGRAEVP